MSTSLAISAFSYVNINTQPHFTEMMESAYFLTQTNDF